MKRSIRERWRWFLLTRRLVGWREASRLTHLYQRHIPFVVNRQDKPPKQETLDD